MMRQVNFLAGTILAAGDEFIALAEEISGQELDDLFIAWLYESGLPPLSEK